MYWLYSYWHQKTVLQIDIAKVSNAITPKRLFQLTLALLGAQRAPCGYSQIAPEILRISL